MENKLLYLAGGMSGLARDEQWQWRKDVRTKILESIYFYGYDYMPVFFNPLMHYTLDEELHKSEREVFELETYNVRKSELHPWLIECTTRMCDTFDELIDYVACQHLMA